MGVGGGRWDENRCDVVQCHTKNSSHTRKGEKSLKFWQAARGQGLDFPLARFLLHELVEEAIYCPFRCLLHRLSQTQGGHHEEVRILDLGFSVHEAVRK